MCSAAVPQNTEGYKLERYLADPKECCIGGKTTSTCDPQYSDTTSIDCFPYLDKYCNDPKTIFSDAACKTWCGKYQDECDNIKLTICKNPSFVDTPDCVEWSKGSTSTSPPPISTPSSSNQSLWLFVPIAIVGLLFLLGLVLVLIKFGQKEI
jgi:hypothetical protein